MNVTADQLLDEARSLEALALRAAVRARRPSDYDRVDTYRHAARTLRRHALELSDPDPESPRRLLVAA